MTYADDATTAAYALFDARADHEAAMGLVRQVVSDWHDTVPIATLARDLGVTRQTVYTLLDGDHNV